MWYFTATPSLDVVISQPLPLSMGLFRSHSLFRCGYFAATLSLDVVILQPLPP